MIQRIPSRLRIVVLEDNAERRAAMLDCLADRFGQYDFALFATAGEIIDHLRRKPAAPLAICLDHDLDLIPIAEQRLIDPGSGRDVADYLATLKPVCPIIIHSSNTIAVAGMTLVLEDSGWHVHRVIPAPDVEWIYNSWAKVVRNAIVDHVGAATVNGTSATPGSERTDPLKL